MKGDRRCTANRENVEECESRVYKSDIDLLLDFKLYNKKRKKISRELRNRANILQRKLYDGKQKRFATKSVKIHDEQIVNVSLVKLIKLIKFVGVEFELRA